MSIKTSRQSSHLRYNAAHSDLKLNTDFLFRYVVDTFLSSAQWFCDNIVFFGNQFEIRWLYIFKAFNTNRNRNPFKLPGIYNCQIQFHIPACLLSWCTICPPVYQNRGSSVDRSVYHSLITSLRNTKWLVSCRVLWMARNTTWHFLTKVRS